MAIQLLRGNAHVEYYPKTASTAFTYGTMVSIPPTASGVGTLIATTFSSPSVIGLILKAVAATDTDWASATLVPVLVPDVDTEFLVTATGTAAATDVGEFIDATDNVSVNVAAYTYGAFLVKAVISATQVIVSMCKKSGPAITTS